MPNIHLVVIDGQQDFCDPSGSLFVPGATADMDRMGAFIQDVDIAHPVWYQSAETGDPPPPFTTMQVEGGGRDARIMGHHPPPALGGDGRVV